jgi:hypothetical protein
MVDSLHHCTVEEAIRCASHDADIPHARITKRAAISAMANHTRLAAPSLRFSYTNSRDSTWIIYTISGLEQSPELRSGNGEMYWFLAAMPPKTNTCSPWRGAAAPHAAAKGDFAQALITIWGDLLTDMAYAIIRAVCGVSGRRLLRLPDFCVGGAALLMWNNVEIG